MSYIIGTGYHQSQDPYINDYSFFKDIWLPNTLNLQPKRIVIVTSGVKLDLNHPLVEYINLPNKTLHVKDMGKSHERFGGWSLSFINSALYAYSCKSDFIYKEQDCLTFGDIIPKIINQTDSYMMSTGELFNLPNPSYSIELSLMYIKYEFIPTFISELLSIPQNDGGVNHMRPEVKFLQIKNKYPNKIKFFTQGYGGNRPYIIEDQDFYIQKPRWFYNNSSPIPESSKKEMFSRELEDLKSKNLI